MKSLVDYFGCGDSYIYKDRDAIDYKVFSTKDLSEKIIPFFDKYPLEGVKKLNFAYFKKIDDIKKVKGHLTKQGLEQIQLLKDRMNKS